MAKYNVLYIPCISSKFSADDIAFKICREFKLGFVKDVILTKRDGKRYNHAVVFMRQWFDEAHDGERDMLAVIKRKGYLDFEIFGTQYFWRIIPRFNPQTRPAKRHYDAVSERETSRETSQTREGDDTYFEDDEYYGRY